MKEKEITVSGKSVEEAIEEALKNLGLSQDQVTIEILEEPKKGWLGLIGGRPASVRVVEKVDPINQTVSYLLEVLEKMGIETEVNSVKKSQRDFIFEMTGEKVAIAIGKRGQTLNALQTLVNLFANQLTNEHYRIVLDAEDYRSRREESLKGLAKRVAIKVVKTKKAVQLEPMPSYERKIIHSELQNNPNVVTLSKGEEPHRYIKVDYKD